MARKKKHEEHENHERWLVSYADFITLLFAFFVVMYSVSSVNEGKYRVLSESLDAAFRSANRSVVPIQIGDITRAPRTSSIAIKPPTMKIGLQNMPSPRFSGAQKGQQYKGDIGNKGQNNINRMKHISKQLNRALGPLVEKGLVDVSKNKSWVKVNINSSILFSSGSATLSRQSIPVLERIAKIIKPLDVSIHVEGFTDNVPIKNLVYPSNWELSASRAASVVHLFAKTGIDPKRMAAIGYGEFHPVADNSTREGRKKNRRVVLIINSAKSPRFEEQQKGVTEKSKSGVVSQSGTRRAKAKTKQNVSSENKPRKFKTRVRRKKLPVVPNFIELPSLPKNINQ
jgi:chemotaxis protein MotB